jgi:preprotein translocase subunit SecE
MAKKENRKDVASRRKDRPRFKLPALRRKRATQAQTKRRRIKIPLPQYVRDSVNELKKVTWPSRSETWKLTLAVFIFSAVFTLIIVIADFGFEALAERLFL